MKRVVWSDVAFNDLDIIHDFIGAYSDNLANSTILKILSRTKQLEMFGLSGAILALEVDTKKEYRYLVEGDYKIIYSVSSSFIFIETVFDTRMNPDTLKL